MLLLRTVHFTFKVLWGEPVWTLTATLQFHPDRTLIMWEITWSGWSGCPIWTELLDKTVKIKFQRSRLKYRNSYWMDCHTILHSLSRSQENESSLVRWSADVLSNILNHSVKYLSTFEMDWNNVGDLLTFPLTPPWGLTFMVLSEISLQLLNRLLWNGVHTSCPPRDKLLFLWKHNFSSNAIVWWRFLLLITLVFDYIPAKIMYNIIPISLICTLGLVLINTLIH